MNGIEKDLSLRETLLVPDLRTNLISVSRMADKGYTVVFDNEKEEVVDGDSRVAFTAKRDGGLYYVRNKDGRKACNEPTASAAEFADIQLLRDVKTLADSDAEADNTESGGSACEDSDDSAFGGFRGFPDTQAVITEPARRGRGRPRMLRTGGPGTPKKVYQEAQFIREDSVDFAFLTEVPVKLALSGSDSNEWMRDMASEVRSIILSETWELVERPRKRNAIGSRFVLRNKYGINGALEKRKATIVARGFSQQPGRDFLDTSAPVARLCTIRLSAALAARNGCHIRQYDVTTAYLNGNLEEEIYMEVPEAMEEVLQHMLEGAQ